VGIQPERVTHTTDTEYPGHYAGEDHAWDLEEFRNKLSLQIHQYAPYDMVFSLISIPAPVANAFRRIMIAHLPTLALERIYIHNNTTVIQDEVLAHRLGLIPFAGPQSLLKKMRWPGPKTADGEEPTFQDVDTLVFKLDVECKHNPEVSREEPDPTKAYINAHIYAKDIEWIPKGRQVQWMGEQEGMRPVHPDILVTKMRPGQVIELEAHAVKGVGADHAKWSPVATATYRLLPTIDIVKPILGEDAKKFARCFPKGVISLENVTEEEASRQDSGYEGHAGEKKAVVKDTFKDTVSRECLRHSEFEGKVKLGRRRDHFIFSVESTGQYESDYLFLESVKMLRQKCADLKEDLKDIQG
jgi:DNA-directed RNA polymerase I and III subunit RPAC1